MNRFKIGSKVRKKFIHFNSIISSTCPHLVGIHGFTVNDRLFTEPTNADDNGCAVCNVCLVPRKKPSQRSPSFVRFVCPSNRLIHVHVPMCTVVLCIVHSSTLYAVSGTMRTYNFPYFVTYPSENCAKDTFKTLVCVAHRNGG